MTSHVNGLAWIPFSLTNLSLIRLSCIVPAIMILITVSSRAKQVAVQSPCPLQFIQLSLLSPKRNRSAPPEPGDDLLYVTPNKHVLLVMSCIQLSYSLHYFHDLSLLLFLLLSVLLNWSPIYYSPFYELKSHQVHVYSFQLLHNAKKANTLPRFRKSKAIPVKDRLCGLVVRVPGCRAKMYCASCEVRTEFIYVM
jgi:hypothetical protein